MVGGGGDGMGLLHAGILMCGAVAQAWGIASSSGGGGVLPTVVDALCRWWITTCSAPFVSALTNFALPTHWVGAGWGQWCWWWWLVRGCGRFWQLLTVRIPTCRMDCAGWLTAHTLLSRS